MKLFFCAVSEQASKRSKERERAKGNDKTVYMDLKQWVNRLCVHFSVHGFKTMSKLSVCAF